MEPQTNYAHSGDAYIAYQAFGSGPPLVIAVGYMSHLEQNWEWPEYARIFTRLGRFARVIIFDRRGTGLSDRVIGATFDEMMDDIRAVMDAEGLDRAALLGGAEGGPMCMLFAATFPARTSALILFGTYARRMWASDYPWGITPDRLEQAIQSFDKRWGRDAMGIHAMAPSLADDGRFLEWYIRASRYGGTPGTARAWYRMTAEIDVRAVLPSIRIPTLVMHREGDRSIPVGAGRYLAQHIPSAKYVEFPGEDHWWFAGDAEGFLVETQEFLTGVRPIPESDRVLATVLFTDIIGSTQRAAELGDAQWKRVLEAHHTIVRNHLRNFRGREIDTAGDAFLATFDGPARAIRCAQSLLKDVRRLGLTLRAGLHTGEIEVLGDDIGGLAVHIASRVMAMAEGDEVVVSSTVKDLVAGSGIEFYDRGVHSLKGVPEDWHLYAVRQE